MKCIRVDLRASLHTLFIDNDCSLRNAHTLLCSTQRFQRSAEFFVLFCSTFVRLRESSHAISKVQNCFIFFSHSTLYGSCSRRPMSRKGRNKIKAKQLVRSLSCATKKNARVELALFSLVDSWLLLELNRTRSITSEPGERVYSLFCKQTNGALFLVSWVSARLTSLGQPKNNQKCLSRLAYSASNETLCEYVERKKFQHPAASRLVKYFFSFNLLQIFCLSEMGYGEEMMFSLIIMWLEWDTSDIELTCLKFKTLLKII